MIIADTSGLLANYDTDDPAHTAVAAAVQQADDGPIVISPYVVAELDYLVAGRHGVARELAALRELSSDAYELAQLTSDDLRTCAEVIERYADQGIGVTDSSLVVLAKRYDTRRILTLDHRHFDVLRPLDGGRFQVVPG